MIFSGGRNETVVDNGKAVKFLDSQQKSPGICASIYKYSYDIEYSRVARIFSTKHKFKVQVKNKIGIFYISAKKQVLMKLIYIRILKNTENNKTYNTKTREFNNW